MLTRLQQILLRLKMRESVSKVRGPALRLKMVDLALRRIERERNKLPVNQDINLLMDDLHDILDPRDLWRLKRS